MRIFVAILLLLPFSLCGQVLPLLDSIAADKIYRYEGGDFTKSPHYEELARQSTASLKELQYDHFLQKLYVQNVLLERAYKHDMALPWPAPWQSWLKRFVGDRLDLVARDVVLKGQPIAVANAASLMIDHPLSKDLLAQIEHPLLQGYIGCALARRQSFGLLNLYFDDWLTSDYVILQQEGCNHYDRLVGDYILSGANRPGQHRRIVERYQDILLTKASRLDATADLLMAQAAPDSLLDLCDFYLAEERLPVAAASSIIQRRDSLAAPTFSRLVDIICNNRLDPRQLGRLESFFLKAGKSLLKVVESEDLHQLHTYILKHRDSKRIVLAWPFYRWLHKYGYEPQLVHAAVQRRVIPREQLNVAPSPTYKVTFK